MPASIYIGKIFGTFLFVFALGGLLEPTYYKKVFTEIFTKPALMTLRGVLSLLVGLIMVVFHNVWNQHWEMSITIIAWIVLLQGIFCVIFPKTMINIARNITSKTLLWIFWIVLVVGAYLIYMSYFFVQKIPS
jgi:hypothetical protein